MPGSCPAEWQRGRARLTSCWGQRRAAFKVLAPLCCPSQMKMWCSSPRREASLPFPWAITPTPQDVPSALGHTWYLDQRGTLWYCQLRAGTATTRPHPRWVEGSGHPREGAGRMRLEGAQGTQRQWGCEVTAGGAMCEPRLQAPPLERASFPWTSLTKHIFKGKIIKGFKMVTEEHQTPALGPPSEPGALWNSAGHTPRKPALSQPSAQTGWAWAWLPASCGHGPAHPSGWQLQASGQSPETLTTASVRARPAHSGPSPFPWATLAPGEPWSEAL